MGLSHKTLFIRKQDIDDFKQEIECIKLEGNNYTKQYIINKARRTIIKLNNPFNKLIHGEVEQRIDSKTNAGFINIDDYEDVIRGNRNTYSASTHVQFLERSMDRFVERLPSSFAIVFDGLMHEKTMTKIANESGYNYNYVKMIRTKIRCMFAKEFINVDSSNSRSTSEV